MSARSDRGVCDSKAHHDDQASAEREADRLARQGGKRPAVFVCPACGRWVAGRRRGHARRANTFTGRGIPTPDVWEQLRSDRR